MSTTPSARTATTEGPPSSGRQTRPAERGVGPILGKAVLGGGGEIKRHVVVPGFVGRFSFSGERATQAPRTKRPPVVGRFTPVVRGKLMGRPRSTAHGEEGEALGLDRVAAP